MLLKNWLEILWQNFKVITKKMVVFLLKSFQDMEWEL